MSKSQRFTLNDLKSKGLVENKDGSFSKPGWFKDQINAALVNHKKLSIEAILSGSRKAKVAPPVYFNHMDIQDVYAKCEAEGTIFIPGHVPSSKNSMVPFKGRMVYSKETTTYKKQSEIHWRVFASKFRELCQGKEKPYRIEMTFIRPDRRKADHHNLCQLPMDIMVKMGWLDDDNMDEALVIPGNPPYGHDPKLPGILIRVL